MAQKVIYDISEVCRMLGVTSRTLRFYEQKGIVESTLAGGSLRRRYTEEQVAHIRNVLVLRALGLSIKSIAELQNQNTDLKSAVLLRRAKILALMDQHHRELHLLNQALGALDRDENIFEEQNAPSFPIEATTLEELVSICTDAIIFGKTEELYRHLGRTLKDYMPPEAYERIREDTLAPLGCFAAAEKTERDPVYPNVVYQYLRYEKMGLLIKFVFTKEEIGGLWMGYYQL